MLIGSGILPMDFFNEASKNPFALGLGGCGWRSLLWHCFLCWPVCCVVAICVLTCILAATCFACVPNQG